MSERLPELDAFKGLLITLIVIGHNTLFSAQFPTAFSFLYNFHVASFLLLPFLFLDGSMRMAAVRDQAARYLVPHFVFFGIGSVAYLLLFVAGSGVPYYSWAQDAVLAVLISSEGTYNAATGFRFYWFLPALFTLSLVAHLMFSVRSLWRGILLSVFVLTHLLLGLLPASWLTWFPWGLPLVLFLYPIGLTVHLLWRRHRIERSAVFELTAITGFIGCSLISLKWPSYVGLAGDPTVYAINDADRLIFHDAFLLTAFFGLLFCCYHLPRPAVAALAMLGERSLGVFLIHPFVWQSLLRIGFVDYLSAWGLGPLLEIGLSVAATIGLSLGILSGIQRIYWLNNLLFPRSLASWKAAWRRSAAD